MAVEVQNPMRRAALVAGATLVVYVASVAPHEGEFWPFSIFPMFSRAGKTWTRCLVVELSPDSGEPEPAEPNASDWGPWSMENLPGRPFATRSAHVSTNDLSKFIQLTKTWTQERKHALRALFASPLDEGRNLLLVRVDGAPAAAGKVDITLTGLVRMSGQKLVVNPAFA